MINTYFIKRRGIKEEGKIPRDLGMILASFSYGRGVIKQKIKAVLEFTSLTMGKYKCIYVLE